VQAEVQMLQGQSQWAQQARQRLLTSKWVFAPNGEFALLQSQMPPIVGTWDRDGSTIRFQATRTTSSGRTELSGQLDVNSAVVSLDYVAATAYAANVDNTQFGSTTSEHFQAQAQLQPMQ
jgi:hypothetical protein